MTKDAKDAREGAQPGTTAFRLSVPARPLWLLALLGTAFMQVQAWPATDVARTVILATGNALVLLLLLCVGLSSRATLTGEVLSTRGVFRSKRLPLSEVRTASARRLANGRGGRVIDLADASGTRGTVNITFMPAADRRRLLTMLDAALADDRVVKNELFVRWLHGSV